MLSLYEILKASKTGIAPDMWTALAGKNWSGADSGHEIKELTGIPPLSFRADGTPLLDFLISGDMVQSGTPTPTTPIQPQECGDLETTGVHAGQYKIPILNNSQPTNVYLGEVQTTRKIRKLVLTGKEDDTVFKMQSSSLFYLKIASKLGYDKGRAISSHYINQQVANAFMTDLRIKQDVSTSAFGSHSGVIVIKHTDYTTLADFKTYLQQQYANGTPVTVWYVLAEPETGIVNEPLRKIGDYADTLSMEQAGVEIPTIKGNTVIDVETTLKPSEMYIKYRG